MTDWYVKNDLVVCATRLLHMWATPNSYAWHDSLSGPVLHNTNLSRRVSTSWSVAVWASKRLGSTVVGMRSCLFPRLATRAASTLCVYVCEREREKKWEIEREKEPFSLSEKEPFSLTHTHSVQAAREKESFSLYEYTHTHTHTHTLWLARLPHCVCVRHESPICEIDDMQQGIAGFIRGRRKAAPPLLKYAVILCVYVWTYMWVCTTCTYTCIHLRRIFWYIYRYTYMCIYVYIWTYIHMYINIYTYIYIYIYIYIHAYICIYNICRYLYQYIYI